MISAKDVLTESKTIQKSRTKIFQRFVDQCIDKIRNTVRTRPEITFITYNVPPFILGMPIYEIGECIKYISNEFERTGFAVKNLGQNVLLISWDKPYISMDIKKTTQSFRPISGYKPMGGFSYDNSLLQTIENKQVRFK